MSFESLEEIQVWQLSRKYFKLIFNLTQKVPFKNDFRFRDQLRAASGSIMDNIAEGFGRGGNKEFINFLSIAKGSIEETRSQLYRANDIGYLSEDEFNEAINMANSIAKMTASLQTYLRKSDMKGKKYNTLEEGIMQYTINSNPETSEPRTLNSEHPESTEPRTQNSEQED